MATLLKALFESHAVNAPCMTAATDIQHDKVSLSWDSGYRCYSGPGKQEILISVWTQMGDTYSILEGYTDTLMPTN